MKTLLQKEIVYDFGRPLKKYALTEEGWEVAKRMKKVALPSNQGTLAFGNQLVTSPLPSLLQHHLTCAGAKYNPYWGLPIAGQHGWQHHRGNWR